MEVLVYMCILDIRSLQDDKEKKRLEALQRKKEKEQMLEEEMASIKSAKPAPAPKVTRAQIESQKAKEASEAGESPENVTETYNIIFKNMSSILFEASLKKTSELVHTEVPLEENLNQLEIEGARTVDEAITALRLAEKTWWISNFAKNSFKIISSSGEAKAEKHPEKRMKASYTAYEERRLPMLKAENPNMRLSQLKQMLKKDWMKAPENPMNQRVAAYNEKSWFSLDSPICKPRTTLIASCSNLLTRNNGNETRWNS